MQTDHNNDITTQEHWEAYWVNYRYDKVPDKYPSI